MSNAPDQASALVGAACEEVRAAYREHLRRQARELADMWTVLNVLRAEAIVRAELARLAALGAAGEA